MARRLPLALAALLVLAACGEGASPVDPAVAEGVDLLSPTEHLTRVSMALRGVRPTAEEILAVEQDPTWLPSIVDFYLMTPEFGETVEEMHADAFLLNVDSFSPFFGFTPQGDLADVTYAELNDSLTSSPMKLIRNVVMTDRPYSEIVTADYVLADRNVATVWGLPYDTAAGGWQATRFTDGRPLAGVLSDNAVFQRHDTTDFNRNRGRANAISSALLCYDFLDRRVEIDTDVDLSDTAAIENAIADNASCQSCHQTLDPLASYFSAYSGRVPAFLAFEYPVPFSTFQPDSFQRRRVTPPAFFGQPSANLGDLGQQIADDPRFGLCAVRRFASYLLRVPLDDVPRAVVERHYREFVDDDLSARELARNIVLSDEFQVAGSDREEDAWMEGVHIARPTQLARSVEALTGYRMQVDVDLFFPNDEYRFGDFDLMTDAFLGFEVLAGGTDSVQVTDHAQTMNATSDLVREALSLRAALYVALQDFTQPDMSQRRMFTLVRGDEIDEASVRAQLADWYLRLYGEVLEPTDPELDEAWQLFNGLRAASGENGRAWVLTLAALFDDLRFATY